MATRRRPGPGAGTAKPSSQAEMAATASTPRPALAAARNRPGLIAALSAAFLVALSLSMIGTGPGDPEAVDGPMVTERLPAAPMVPLEAQSHPPSVLEPLDFDHEFPEDFTWQYVQVAPGETLERIFRRLGLSPRLLHQVVNLDELTRQLARIRPGDEFAFDIDPDDGFRALRAELDDQTWLFVEITPEGLASRTESRALDIRVVEATGEIRSSLFNAAKAVGLSDNMTLRMANIFGWDIDFALDIRAGDRFAVIYEEIYRDGEFLRHGAILAASFVNRGRSFEAVRFDAGNGPDYYAPDGRPMRKAFLRAPLNFTRVTSNFNPRRFHPITRQVRPHNGTDYGAPTGTPVWAAGDGRVIRAAYNGVNGNYIFIQHGNHIITRYLHLSRRQVNEGDRVRQGQTIGRVGATGLATGPHLHYEFLVNNRHRDPRTVDLPQAEPLPEAILPEFKRHSEPLLAKLDEIQPGGVLLASAEKRCPDGDKNC